MSISYYKRPELGKDADTYTQRLTEIQAATEQTKAIAEEKDAAFSRLSTRMQLLKIRAEKGDNAAAEKYNSMLGQYRAANLERKFAIKEHNKNVSAWDEAYAAFETYANNQVELEKQWRSTIRDSATVKAELDGVQEQIRKLSRQDTVGKVLTTIGNAAQNAVIGSTGLMPATQQYQSQNAAELARLQEREKLLREEYDWAQHYYYAGLKDAADFSAKSQYEKKLQGGDSQKYADITYEVVNKNNDVWSQISAEQAWGKVSDDALSKLHSYAYMTDEEVANYNYCYAIGGKDAAEAYLNRIQEELNARKAGKMYEKLEGKTGAEMLFGIAAGFDQANSGLRNLVNTKDDYIPYSSIQIASGKVREDLGKAGPKVLGSSLGQIGYDAVTTTSNMAPSFLTSLAVGMINPAAGAAVGNVMMGASAAGNAYREKLNLGYTKDQARTYGLLVGASEALLEKALGGISKLGGGALSKTALKNIGKFDNVLTKFAKSAGGQILMNAGSEALEEGLQSVLEPYLWKAVSNEAVSVDWEEAAYSALLGFATGGVAESTDKVITQAVPKAQATAKTLQEAVQQQVNEKLTAEKPVQAGTVELDVPTVRVSDEVWQQSQRLAAATGRKIRLYEGAENVNGSYDTESGTIWVNTNGGDVLTQVFSHEMTHSLEEAGAYEKLSEIVLSRMQATGIDLDVAREAKRKQYERQGHALQTAAAVDQELVAEYVSKYLLTDEASIVSLVKQDRTLGQRIKDWFDSILAKLGNKNAQERAFLVRARDIYAKALRQTQGVGAAQTEAASAPMGEQRAADSAVESTDDYVETLNALLAAGEITDDQYDTAMDEYEQWQEEQRTAGERKYSFKGYADDGRGIYESNFPRGTPKKAKGERILKYIQDVWSKKPITLRITDGGTTRYIEAQFDPTYSEDKNVRTDASKLMGGNRHGNATEQRVTLDLADDYYQIASESEYNYSKDESGKNSDPHQGVKQWHYFVNDIYFAEQGSEELVPYRVSINVKEKGDGHYFYSFSAEKTEGTPTQRTLHAAVNDSENATANGSSSTSIIHPDAEEVNKKFPLGEDVVSKKDVARELQAILQRGGDIQELKRYVAQLERSGGKTEQKGSSAGQTRSEAEQIVRKAKQQGISVEQYLQENAELYDVDGTWSEDARKALEMEKKGSGRKWSLSDASDRAYLDAVNRGDMKTAQEMVDRAAKKAEYDSPLLYHGTKAFGFTRFDLSKMDDKRSIFLTDNERIAATYSGVMGKRDASGHTLKDVETLSYNELVEELNAEQFGTVVDPDDKTNYAFYSMQDINALIDNVNTELDSLKAEVPQMIREYADRMATEFDDKAHRTHEQLVKLDRLLQGYAYSDVSTQLYMLLHYSDAFNTTGEEASRIANLEKHIRLMNKLIVAGDPDGVIVESWLDGYSLNVLNKQQAMDRLDAKRKTGNYGLYAKLGKSLVIDAKGAVWNDIRHWSDSIGYNWDNTSVEKQGDMFILMDKNTGDEITEGSVAVNSYTEGMPARQLQTHMLRKAQDSLAIITESINTTREIAAFAQKRGYDSVVFKHLRDNGGNNAFIGADEEAGIYVLFDPSQAKAADPVTYDDSGNVIPLSQRFNETKSDIRYSLGEEAEAPKAEADIRSGMPKKAKDYLKRVERELLWTVADKLNVPKLAGREYLQPIIQEMSDEYLKEGTISQETRDLLFEKAYAQGVIVDAEFYDAYKHIKEHLRSLSVTISDRDKADIADFKDFRRRAFGTLRIVNEGGLPVDAAYQELHSMAPELFPENITHPADQLVRMYDAARSIQVTEKTVQDYYGEYEPEYRRWAKADFEEAVSAVSQELWTVKRYADEKAAKDAEGAPATAEETAEAYKELKAARRTYERAAAKNLLSEHDQMQVGRLLRHEIELEHLDPEKDNVKGIAAVFEAKQEYERLCKLIAEYKQHLRGEARKRADGYLQTANDWKDKKVGIAYSRETMERNIFDIVKDKALAQRIIDQYFTPVHKGEAEATRFKSDYRDRVRALELSRKVEKGNLVSEAHAVQLLGEAEDNIRMLENVRGRIKNRDGKNLSEWQAVVQKLWDENPNLDQEKIKRAVKEFRYIYDALFQKMNQVRVANGYEPVNYRNGYFPHFQPGDSDSILAQFGRALGIDTRIDALPTTINGLTHTFKPGIQWFGNAQERLGFNTAYDAVEGFDKYIEGVASVIHQTANIQNLRALASQIRYRTSDDGIREQVDAIQERAGLSEEEKQQLIQEIYAHGKFTLSNFVTELDEYTNLLANKKSRYDRSIEAAIGRKAYTFLKAWEARVGANMIAGNLTSALTNFIPLTQAGAQMDRFALLKGMFGTLQSYRSDDGIVNQSTFLTNRRGSDPLVQTWAQKASDKLGKPMELIDGFVAGSIVRGAYQQNLKRGMSEVEAMNQADAFAASVMADRSKGAMPTLMQASNPLFKAFTQFQLEVNNQFSEVFKDIPRRFKEKGLATLAWVLLKYFLGAWIYNALYEELIGRRPPLDPIGMLCQGYDDLQNDGFGAAGANLAVNALEQLPFSSGLTLIGVELDGGRIPASSAVPDLTALWDAATAEGWSAEKRWKEVQDELNKLAYVVTPFGGNQVSKFVKGVKAYAKGGSYNVDAEGNDTLQYPVYKDDPQDAFWSLVKAAFLGKSSLDTAQEWVDSGFDGLNAEQTATYQELLKLGAADRTAFDAVTQLKNAGSKDMDKLQVIPGLALADEEKAVLVGSVLGTELLTESGGLTQYAKFDYAIQNGMSVDQYIEYRASGADMDKYLELRDAGAAVEDAMSTGMALAELKEQVEDPTTVQKWRVVIDSTDDAEKQLISLSAVMTGSQYAKVKAAYGFGVSPEIYVEVNELLPKYDADGNGRYTQAEVTKAIGSMNAKSSVKAALWQLITGSSSAKNNPYSQAIGQKVIAAWEKAKAESEAEGLSFQEEIMRQIMGG